MPVHASDALILRTYRYGEADRIVVFLTADRGKKRGVAKNASRSMRRFGGGLEPLTRGRVSYVEREHRDLVHLDRIEPSSSPLSAVGSPAAHADAAEMLGHAGYFAELLDEWAPESSPNERLFRLGVAVGAAMLRGGSIAALARYFEYWLLRLEGVYPAIDVCPRCGRAVLGEGAVLVVGDRSFVCRGCVEYGAGLSSGAMRFLRQSGAHTPVEVGAASAPPDSLRELEHVHRQLIALHLDKELRSARVVRELRRES